MHSSSYSGRCLVTNVTIWDPTTADPYDPAVGDADGDGVGVGVGVGDQ
jgi:hypothetical protein